MKKRGISPLIATILLIGLVVIMALLIFNWIGSVVEKQSEDTDKLIEFQMSNLEFDFDCENYSDETKINILLKNEYNGLIDDFFVIYNDSTSGLIDVSLSAYQSSNIEVLEKTSSFIEIVPQIEIDGELKSLTHKKILKSCINVQLAPACSDGIDNDDDGFFDYDGAGHGESDAGCSDEFGTSEETECQDADDNDEDGYWDLADPDCVNVQETSEGGTISFSSCDDSNLVNSDFLSQEIPFILMNDISTNSQHCFVFDAEFDNEGYSMEIDCDGHTIDGNDVADSYGLWFYGASNNIYVHNCTITGFERGLFMDDGASDSILQDILFDGNRGSGQGSGIVIGGNDEGSGDGGPPVERTTFKDITIRNSFVGFLFNDMNNLFSSIGEGNTFENILIEDNDIIDLWCLEDAGWEPLIISLIGFFTTDDQECIGEDACCDAFGFDGAS